MKMDYRDLPVIANITIPIRIKHMDDRENKENHFCCGFANFKLADNIADVSDNAGNEIGTLGGSFGGFYEINRYYPEHEKYKQWYNVQINTDDIWYAVEEVLNKVQSDPDEMAKLREKMKAYVEKSEKLAEIEKMQKDAEKEAELNKKIAEEEAEIKRLEDELNA